ncbi:YciI family protein [Paenibacillus sp. CC-CFT747]|nr:YciI family protein [Paenibacillus sp. CC-CFT747]
MRYMVMIQATGFSEAGIGPGPEHEEAMAAYRRALAGAGVLLAAEELVPSAAGMRITYPAAGGEPEVEAGPFSADGGLVAAYAVLEVESEDEALQWVLRMPVPAGRGRTGLSCAG